MNKIQFFKPDFRKAKQIRFLRPKEKYFHFHYDLTKGIDSKVLCTNSLYNNCPVCNIVEQPKSLILRLKIFYLDIKEAFNRLFKGGK